MSNENKPSVMNQQPPPNVKFVLRMVLLISSVAMAIFGVLTLRGVVGLEPFLGWIFIAVAITDTVIAMVVFK